MNIRGLAGVLVLLLVMSASSAMVLGTTIGTVSAETDGDFEYTPTNGGTTAEIIGYTGTSQAIVIPSTVAGLPVTSIGAEAFYYTNTATKPISVIIPEGVTSIGDSAFRGCTAMTSVTIPSSVTRIGLNAFNGCSVLPTVTIPSGVTTISDGTFRDCTSFTNITIPNGVTSVGKYAFNGDYNLLSLTIPNSVVNISDEAFSACGKVKSLILGSGVQTIGNNAFWGLDSVSSVSIPKSVTTVGNYAFSASDSLSSVTFEGNVTSIGAYAFSSCGKLTSIWFKGYVAPIAVGTNWVQGASSSIVGHAYAGSNFPAPGQQFYGLTMSDVITASSNTGGSGTSSGGTTDTTGGGDSTSGGSTSDGTSNSTATASGGTDSGLMTIIGLVAVVAAAALVGLMVIRRKRSKSPDLGGPMRSSGLAGLLKKPRPVSGQEAVARSAGPVDVFISHVEEDYDLAKSIALGLEKMGYSAWYYERDCVPGTSYLVETGEAIGRSSAFLLLISKDSLGSHQIDVEIERAHEDSKPFIPLRVGISHNDFQSRRPLWKQAVGTTTSIEVRSDQIDLVIAKVAEGLKGRGIYPKTGNGH